MQIGVMKIKLYAPWVHSLKEKRKVVKSLVVKIKNKFNVSVAEVEEQDTHQIIVISMCSVFTTGMKLDNVWDTIINFIENTTEAEITDITREIR